MAGKTELADIPVELKMAHGAEGMTLRDWFAGQIFAAIYLDFGVDRRNGTPLPNDWKNGMARNAYQVADAMIEARREP